MYNNYDNDKFNNDPKPLFSNEFPGVEINNSVVNGVNDFSNSAQDIPPSLEPIKNLSDATIINAPTLDVLDPMNIMPESFENKEPAKVDPLDAYDNGINYEPKVNFPIDNEISNISPSFGGAQSMVNTTDSAPVSAEIPNVENNFAVNKVNFDIPNIENNTVLESTGLEIPTIENYNNIFNPTTLEIDNLNTMDISAQGSKEKNEFDIKPIVNEGAISNFDIEPVIDYSKEEDKHSEETLTENSTYEIMQDKIEQENPMLNLGIDNAYDDIDMLDIVDIDEENKEESNNIEEAENSVEEKEPEEKTLILDNINEIKELINKIKERGINIELEEFDFEHMYQLIVKIEK